MAIFFPSLDEIKFLKVKPEEGELYFLNFLNSILDNNYEVFFNSFLNGDRPDIIIVRKNAGVMIIEVKDWNFEHYYLDEKRKWRIAQNKAYTRSPLDQVFQYKENMFNLHLENLLEKNIKNSKLWNIVTCAVYFHNESIKTINNFLIDPYKHDRKYLDFLKYNVALLGKDSLTDKNFKSLLSQKRLDGSISSLFDNDIYNSLSKYLKPPKHTYEQGKPIRYKPQQNRIVTSTVKQQLIKGVVGSGKTTVLAGRAVECHKRTNDKVLILCYNITLKNYIHDKLSEIRAEFIWSNFYITNYHYFITAEFNHYGITIKIPEGFSEWSEEDKSEYFENTYYSNENIFEDVKYKIEKYQSILIDEVQDYKIGWLNIIKKYFLADNGDYVLFGDEKQNIYNNEMDIEDKDVKVNVPKSAINKMNETVRLPPSITKTAIKFQQNYLSKKYNIDSELQANNEISYGKVNYIYIPHSDGKLELVNYIIETAKNVGHPNDICILGITIKLLRELDCLYRYKTNQKTKTMFETQEVWNKMFLDTLYKDEYIQNGISLIKNQNIKKDDDKKIAIATLYTLKDIIDTYSLSELIPKYEYQLNDKQINKEDFETWYNKKERLELKKNVANNFTFKERIKFVRDNKKFHFWTKGGLSIFSTIHSYKGYETDTLFLIIEPQYAKSNFSDSIDELIYAGLTRAKNKLFFINFGNNDFDEKLKKIIND
jgi:hypothetical protein